MNGIKSTGKGKSGKSYGAKRVKEPQKKSSSVSQNQPSEDQPEEEVLKELVITFMKKQELFLEDSQKMLSEMLLFILNTPEERLLLLWMLSMLLKDKEDLSMDLVHKYIKLIQLI